RGKAYDQLFYRCLAWNNDKASWELIIPGNTIKGAFRAKAQQILRTLKNGKGCSEKTNSHEGRFCDDRNCPVCSLFGRQGQIAKVFCSDAFLEADDRLLDDEHFSYDQIGIDPKTGKTIDSTKLDFLYAYGQKFPFRCSLVLKDLDPNNMGHLGFLMYLLKELNDGNIPIGGKKTLGFGYVKGSVEKIEFLCGPGSPMEKRVKQWNGQNTGADNLWKRYELKGIWDNQAFRKDMEQGFFALIGKPEVPQAPFKTKAGYVSHRQNSMLCGALIYELEALTPLHVKESGEPSFQGEEAFGYDFFSITPPKNDRKQPMGKREYAIPPSTLKGVVRNIYNIISGTPCPRCSHINNLCDTCRLFGWVGNEASADNALMGRLKFNFARPVEDLSFEWYGTAFGYKGEKSHSVAGNRIFPHTNNPNNAITRHGSGETPENITKNITLNRFASPGSKFQFQVDFTNLENDEFNKILWAIGLEDGLGHKLGKGKALGFGSCAIRLKDAYIINWEDRFSSLTEPGLDFLNIERLKANPKSFANYEELKRAMTVSQ
ncbi:MAG: RAMP superfamily CRISPR-associated protein, partial [Chloroflexota bacterium]|nr:RAMP superfamily CRISPR-associated protein [Chloroflexota bacterium]